MHFITDGSTVLSVLLLALGNFHFSPGGKGAGEDALLIPKLILHKNQTTLERVCRMENFIGTRFALERG